MKFIRTGKSQWYAKHDNHFYCIIRVGYDYLAIVTDLQANRIENTKRICDTKKLAEQHLQKLCNLGLKS